MSDQPVSLSAQTARGALWLSAASLATQALVFAASVIVARMLDPHDYGVAAMAMTVTALAGVFIGFGFAPAIVAGRMSRTRELMSAHWFIVFTGALMSGLVVLAAPLAALFFRDGAVVRPLLVAALLPLLGAWEVVPLAAIQAERRFELVALITVGAQVAMTTSAILLAVLGAGVWALIVPSVLMAGVRAAWATLRGRLPIRLHFRYSDLRGRMREFLHVTGSVITDYLFFNADRVVIGRMLGAEPLGRYNFANVLVSRTLSTFSRTVSQPLLAALGQLRHDRERCDRAVVRACLSIARITFPLAFGGALVAAELIPLLVGEKWRGAVLLAQIFFVLGAFQSVAQITGAVWLAHGRTRLQLLWGVISNAVLVGVFVFGAWLGSAEWVAVGFAAYSILILVPLCVHLTRAHCGLPLRGLLAGIAAVGRDTLGMCLAVSVAGWTLHDLALHPAIVLAAKVAVGATTYALLFRVISADELSAMLHPLPEPVRRAAGRVLRLPAS